MTGAKPRPTISELQSTVSASRLTMWLGCRLRYYFRYVAGITKPKTAALHVGLTVHAVLKRWNLARWRHEVWTADGWKQEFEQRWTDDQKEEPVRWDQDEEPDDKTTAWSLLDLYFRETPIPPNERPEGVEVKVEADLSKHGLPKLIGVLDLVRSGGRILDYKTVGQTPNEGKSIHNHEVQLSGYSILYRESTGKQEGGRELHQLVKTKTPKLIVTRQPPMTEAQQTRLFKQLESYVEGVGRQDFVPSPGMQCCACSYFNECRRWS